MLPAALIPLVIATSFLAKVPAEPGAIVLAEATVYQAVTVDLDGDGAREVALLTRDEANGRFLIGAWTEGARGWSPLVEPLAVASRSELEGPVRLLVRRIDGADRLTLLRQAAGDTPCCLSLHDVRLRDGALRLSPVAPDATSVDAIWVIDLDGDATDELVTSRSLPPLGDTSYPVDAFLHRWTGTTFAVTPTRLPVGSGDTPLVLGDTDGRPGDELGIIATLGRPELHRISLRDGDTLGVEDAGLVARDATAVPIDEGRGIAILTSAGTLAVAAWPFGQELAEPVGSRLFDEGQLLGTVTIAGTPRLVARQPGTADRLHVLGLPTLTPPLFGAVTRTPAAAAFVSGPVQPYVGELPGGDGSGAAIVYAGRLLSSLRDEDSLVPVPQRGMAALPGVQPIGLVGRESASIALVHAAGSPALPGARGGRLDPPIAHPAALVTIAPLALTLEPEGDDGVLDPAIDGAVRLDEGRSLAVGAAGFSARVFAPAGSRVHVAGTDPSVAVAVLSVPPSGELVVPLPPPSATPPEPRYRAGLAVTTPAGHGYIATWDVRVLTQPPDLVAAVRTELGSGTVEVTGRSVPFAAVTVDGRAVALDAAGRFRASVEAPPWPTEIVVQAVDPLGNEARATLSAIGWGDYRQLPWIPIAGLLLAAVAVVYYLRVPRAPPALRRADDDATLEELEPD